MKYLMNLLWAVIFGFVTGFIGSKLSKTGFNLDTTLIVSVLFGLILNILPLVLPKKIA